MFAKITLSWHLTAKFPNSSATQLMESLDVYCTKKGKMIGKFRTRCNDYQNNTLEKFL